jgi:hypothetical protein
VVYGYAVLYNLFGSLDYTKIIVHQTYHYIMSHLKVDGHDIRERGC